MKITKTELKKIIKEELLKEFGSEEFGLQTKEFEPIPEVEFQVGDEVDVMGSALAGAVGEVIEVTRTETGLPAIVLRLLRAADREVYGGIGDEVIARPSTLKSELTFLPSVWDAKQRTLDEDQRSTTEFRTFENHHTRTP